MKESLWIQSELVNLDCNYTAIVEYKLGEKKALQVHKVIFMIIQKIPI